MDIGNVARAALLIYAILMGVGGGIGYVRAHSVPSLISGVGGAILLIVAWFVAQHHPRAGFGAGVVIALILAGALFSRYQKTGHFMPSGALCVVSVIALLIVGAGFVKALR